MATNRTTEQPSMFCRVKDRWRHCISAGQWGHADIGDTQSFPLAVCARVIIRLCVSQGNPSILDWLALSKERRRGRGKGER